jgi:hypothetical protein
MLNTSNGPCPRRKPMLGEPMPRLGGPLMFACSIAATRKILRDAIELVVQHAVP